MNNNIYCNVSKCRFSSYHITSSHKCGSCHKYGHGVMECNDITKITQLHSIPQHCIPKEKQCSCLYGSFHTIEGHICKSCKKFGHNYYDCKEVSCIAPQDDNDIDSKTLRLIESRMSNIDGKIYMLFYTGMGCCYYAKRDCYGGIISLFFMHSDSWGQYGENTSDVPKLRAFLNGYNPLNKISEI
jgi:hypothetical protein